MSAEAVAATFALIFVAELGDKTQLTAMALAARFPWHRVFGGIAAAFALLNALAVLAGQLLWTLLPERWVSIGAGFLFLYFGVASLLSRHDEGKAAGEQVALRRPAVTAFLMIFAAELGDKTQLATASLAAELHDPLSVFVGSTLALWLVSLVGLVVGAQLARRLPAAYLHRAAGVLFLLFGGASLYRALVPA